MQLKLGSKFGKRVSGMFGRYDFQVGVLDDRPYKTALSGADKRSTMASGPVRKKSRKNSGKTVSEISRDNRKRLGFNYLTEPFKNQSSDIVKFSNEFFKLVFGRSQKKRAENLLQAIVRNPILRGEYGPNSEVTKKIKGFDRAMIDTGQLFRSLKAICKVK